MSGLWSYRSSALSYRLRQADQGREERGGRKEGKVPVGDSRCSSHRTRCVTVVCALPVTVDKGSASERQKYTSGSPTHLISESHGSNRLQAEAFRRWIVVHDAIRSIALVIVAVNA